MPDGDLIGPISIFGPHGEIINGRAFVSMDGKYIELYLDEHIPIGEYLVQQLMGIGFYLNAGNPKSVKYEVQEKEKMSDNSTHPLPDGIEYNLVRPGMEGPEELESRFGHHKATIEGPEATLPQHQMLRDAFLDFANFLDSVLDKGREKSLVLTHLEEASMWSHKAIAKNAPLDLGGFGTINDGSGEVTPTPPADDVPPTGTDDGSEAQPASESPEPETTSSTEGTSSDELEDSLDDTGTDDPVEPVTSDLPETQPVEVDETNAIATQEDLSAFDIDAPGMTSGLIPDDGSDHVVAVNPEDQPNVVGSTVPLTEEEKRTVVFGDVNNGSTTEGQL